MLHLIYLLYAFKALLDFRKETTTKIVSP